MVNRLVAVVLASAAVKSAITSATARAVAEVQATEPVLDVARSATPSGTVPRAVVQPAMDVVSLAIQSVIAPTPLLEEAKRASTAAWKGKILCWISLIIANTVQTPQDGLP